MRMNGKEITEVLTPGDARVSGPPRGSMADVRRACNEFFKRTGAPTGMREQIDAEMKKRKGAGK